MSRFGWAYVNDVITGSGGTPGGSDKAIQFASGSTFSGSTNFTFDYTTNTVRLTGTLYADTLIVSSSTIFKSGSTKFGDDPTDTHQFTGSVLVSGSLTATNTITATSASFLDYVQLGTSLSDEVYFNASSKTNIQPATTNDVDLGASSRYWRTGYITTLSSSAISSSVSVYTSEVRAGSVIVNGNISGSGNINGAGLQITGNSSFGSPITVTGTVSSSLGFQTAGPTTLGSSLDVNGTTTLRNGAFLTGTLTVTGGAVTVFGNISGSSLLGNGNGITDINGANVNGVGDDWTIQFKDGNTGTLTGSSNLTFSGSTLTLTGSFLMTGSSTFINIGPTILSGNLNVTGAITGNNVFISGGLSVGNYVQMLPVGNVVIPTNQTASYIYTSGSTNDLYFTQYLPGTSYTNTTRLRWLESSLATGHQHGGILSTVTGTTTFSLTAGSGIIIDQNASLTADSYPTIIKVDWPAYVSQSLDYISSSQVTYISINASGAIQQSTTAPTITQYRDRIVLGRVLHQTGSVTNGVLVIPAVTYGSTSNLLDFTRAFGPLKISGHVLAASGSTLSLTKTAGDSYAEGRNYTSDPESPNIITSANDAALTVSKIYRQYLNVSGNIVTDTGTGLAGYTTIDPTKYNTGGTTSSVGNSEWSNQRVYWFPKAVNRALFVYYGQEKYPTFSDAVAAISVETFTEGSNTAGSAIFVGTITVRGNASTLTATDARITPAGLHRGASGGGGGGGQASAAGSNGYVQYNDSGVLGAESTFTYDSTSNTLSVPNIVASSGLVVTGSIYSTAAFKGGYNTYSSSISIPNTSYFVGLDSNTGILTASLLAATSYPQGQTLILKDIGGYAGTNNILIKASGSETIDGASGVSLTANSSSVTLLSNGSNGFYIVGIV